MNNIFIALGGAGCKVVSDVQNKLNQYCKDNQQKGQSLYIYIDTDEETLNKLEDDEETLKIDLGTYQMQSLNSVMNKSNVDRHFDFSGITIPNTILKDGAKAERQFARAVFNNGPYIRTIQDKFTWILESDKSSNPWDNMNVWVVTGSVGGTGSGIMLDVLYALYRKYNSYNIGNFRVNSIVLLPQMFYSLIGDQNLVKRYKRNGFAFLQELNAFVRYGANSSNSDVFHSFCPYMYDASGIHTNWQPLSTCYLVDDVSQRSKFTMDQIHSNIALFLFSIAITKQNNINDKSLQDSIFTNYRLNFNKEYIDFFSSFGICSIESAFQYYSVYAKTQVAINLLRNILGTGTSIRNEIINYINKSVEKFQFFNDIQTVLKTETNWLFSEKKALKVIAQQVDFSNFKPLLLSDEKHIEFMERIDYYRGNLYRFVEHLKIELLELCQRLLSNDYGLNELLNDLTVADDLVYASYFNLRQTIVDDDIDYLGVMENRSNMYIYYMLAVGDPVMNNRGILDEIITYYRCVDKDFKVLLHKYNHDDLITTLDRIRHSQMTEVLPDFDSIMPDLDINQGVFAGLLGECGFDYGILSNDFLSKVDSLIEFKENVQMSHLPINRIMGLMDKFVSDILVNSNGFNQFRHKSMEQLIAENPDSFDSIASKFRNHEDVFISENNPNDCDTINQCYYLGDFSNPALLDILGIANNDLRNAIIDSHSFKDRIIKIVIRKHISIDDYHYFQELKNEYESGFAKLWQKGKKIATPFIHRDFCNDDFNGDVYSVLLKTLDCLNTH